MNVFDAAAQGRCRRARGTPRRRLRRRHVLGQRFEDRSASGRRARPLRRRGRWPHRAARSGCRPRRTSSPTHPPTPPGRGPRAVPSACRHRRSRRGRGRSRRRPRRWACSRTGRSSWRPPRPGSWTDRRRRRPGRGPDREQRLGGRRRQRHDPLRRCTGLASGARRRRGGAAVVDVAAAAVVDAATVVADESSSSPPHAASRTRPASLPASSGLTAMVPPSSWRTRNRQRLREPPLPRGSGCRTQGQATGLVRRVLAASPLRVSAGLSPDFAGSCDRAQR